MRKPMSSTRLSKMFICKIKTNGDLSFIYDDKLSGLIGQGEAEISRASHVEPLGNQWVADMGPVGGGQLGPYALRKEALDQEVQWLSQNLFGLQDATKTRTE